MDVHPKRSQVAVVDEAGNQQRNRNVCQRPGQAGADPWRVAARHPGGVRGRLRLGVAGGVAGGIGAGAAAGPSQPLQSNRRRSAQERPGRCGHLAQLLRAALLAEAWIAPQATRDLRALLRHRAALVRLSTSRKNRIHAVLADRGIRQQTGLWTGSGRGWLASLELARRRGPSSRTPWPCWTASPNRSPAWTTRSPPGQARPTGPGAEALPGVGRLTAITLVAEIGDSSRFPTARKLCLHRADPGGAERRPQGPPRPQHQAGLGMGALDLQQAAQTAKRSPVFATTSAQLARCRGTQIATVAIARRLLARWFHILKQVQTATPLEKARPGALATPQAPATRPPGLTAQPGRTPPSADPTSGPEWVQVSQLRDAVGVFSPPILPPPSPAARRSSYRALHLGARPWSADTASTKRQQGPQPGPRYPYALDRTRPHGCSDGYWWPWQDSNLQPAVRR
jgi:transposase